MAIIFKLASLIYILTYALKPFEMMELTNEYLKLIPIKKISDYEIKHLLMTLVLTIRFVVLYSFFFCRIVNDYIQRFRLAQSIHDQVTTPPQVIKKAEKALPTTPKTDKSILINQATLDPLPNPPQETAKIIVNDVSHSLHHEINNDDNKSEDGSINPTPTSSSNNTTSSSASSITEHSSIDLPTNEPALDMPFMDKKINEPVAVQTQLEPYTILSTVPNDANNNNHSLEKENDIINILNEKEKEEKKEEKKEEEVEKEKEEEKENKEKETETEKEQQILSVPESTVDRTQDTQEEIASVAQKFPTVPSTEAQETASSPVVQNNSPSEGSVTPALTSASSSHVSPESHRSNSNSSFKLRSSSLLSALKGGEQKQQQQEQQQIIPQLPEKQVSRFSSMRIGGGHKKKVSEEEPLQPKQSMSTQLKKGLKRFGTKVKHSGKRASKIFD